MTPEQAKAKAKLGPIAFYCLPVIENLIVDAIKNNRKDVDLSIIKWPDNQFIPEDSDLDQLCDYFAALGWRTSETRWAILL